MQISRSRNALGVAMLVFCCVAGSLLVRVSAAKELSTGATTPDCAPSATEGGSSPLRLLPCQTPQFEIPNEAILAESPHRVATADFNRDGKADLVVSTTGSPEKLMVLLGDGSGGFAAPRPFPVGADLLALETGDFNSDNNPDVIVLTTGGSIILFLGNGGGNLGVARVFPLSAAALSLAVGDFNSDQKLDLVVGGGSVGAGFSLMLGTGTGRFSTPVGFNNPQMNLNPKSIVADDFNHDGKLDVVTIGAFSDVVWFFPGNGTGGFGTPISTSVPNSSTLSSGDFNGDGNADLVVIGQEGLNNSSDVRVLLSNGNGTFAPAMAFAVNSNPRYLLVKDLNGDTFQDIATAQSSTGDISVLIGNGAGGFAPARSYTLLGATGLAAADFNGDGRTDIASGSYDPSSNPTYRAAVLLGQQNGFRAPRSYVMTINPLSAAAGDLNNDGRLDLVVVNSGASSGATQGSLNVLLGSSDGSMTPAGVYNAGITPVAVSLADFNLDGKLDAVVANSGGVFSGPGPTSVSVLIGNGSGGFAPATNIAVSNTPKAIVTGDFNHDNKPDFAIITVSSDTLTSPVSLYLGDGMGGFAAPTDTNVGGLPAALVATDYNNDGNLDVIAVIGSASCGTTTGKIALLPGNGSGGFGTQQVLNTNFSPVSLAVGDFNRDGRLDLAVGKACVAPSAVSIWLNNGAGGYSGPTDFPVAVNPRTVQVADINNDGRLDVLAGLPAINAVAVLTGNGNGTFAAARNFKSGLSVSYVLPGDFNQDRAIDLAVVNTFNNNVSVMLNACRRQRSNPFDFDADGKADLSLFRPSAGTWYLLRSAEGFLSQQFGLGTDKVVPGDYDGDGRADLAVFRPDNSTWYILLSASNSLSVTQFGQSGDAPVPEDYDGDGLTDIAVFRAGVWLIKQSSNGQLRTVQFGQSGDRPVSSDYDGDGKADVAVFRAGTWYSLLSFDNTVSAQQFGASGDNPVPADYDGDGRSDVAVFRPSAGFWYLLRSSSGFTGVGFGQSGDLPVAADYDGDGKTDVAVFRPANGVWYILQSSNNSFRADSFGTGGDVPVPAWTLQ